MSDENEKFMQQIHYVMTKCQYRKDMGGAGICSLNVASCEKVLYDGNCEAVAEWYQNRGREEI